MIKSTTANITTTGLQSIIISGIGTPKACLVFFGGKDTDAKRSDSGNMGMGFTDGTTSYSVSHVSEHNKAAPSVNRTAADDRFITSSSEYFLGFDYRASFSQWVTDGIEIDVTEKRAGTYPVTYVFFYGADIVNIEVSKENFNTGSTRDVTSLGFEPDAVFLMARDYIHSDYNETGCEVSYGLAVNDGSDTQRSVSVYDEWNAEPTVNTRSYFSETFCILMQDATSKIWDVTIDTYDANGFTLTASALRNVDVFFLAIEFAADKTIDLVTNNAPTSTGNWSVTGLSGQPEFAFLLTSDNETVDTIEEKIGAGAASFEGSNSYSLGYSNKDAVATAVTTCIYSTSVKTLDAGNVDQYIASFTSFDTNGMTLNFTTAAPTTAKKWAGLYVGEVAASTGFNDRGIARGFARGIF